MSRALLVILGIVVALSFLAWVGMRIRPTPFPALKAKRKDHGIKPLPEGLPAPVDRFYRKVYGDNMPVIKSFILTGRGTVRFQGVTLPARLRFVHDAGKGYRHYIEATFWGIPIFKVNEHFLNGRSRLALPFGIVEDEPQIDQAAALGLWSETLVFPAVYLTTDEVRWEAIDNQKARLVLPAENGNDYFTVKFDENTGLVEWMEAIRWQNAGDEVKKRWQAQAIAWGEMNGWLVPTLFSAQWMDENTPWLVVRLEDITWNVDIDEYIQQNGIDVDRN